MFAAVAVDVQNALSDWACRWTQRDRRGRLRAVATGAALALHALLLLFFISSTHGSEASIGQGSGTGYDHDYVMVSLAGLSGEQFPSLHQKTDPTPPQSDPLKVLFGKLSTDPDAIPVPSKTARPNGTTLLDDVNSAPEAQAMTDPSQDTKKAGDRGSGSASGVARGVTTSGATTVKIGGGDGAPSRGAISTQVDQCWRQTPGRSDVPVTLEVILNDRGQIARPPLILRPERAVLDERRLVAEERAIQAVAHCVPYKTPIAAGNQEVFRLQFQPSP
jgi:hypothetical protein